MRATSFFGPDAGIIDDGNDVDNGGDLLKLS
jgi:hypothetical protein